jgi:hypothetical protein
MGGLVNKQTEIATVKMALKNAMAIADNQHYCLKIETQSAMSIH